MRLIDPVTLTIHTQRVRLWRDDLSRIVEIARSVDPEVSIRTDKYVLKEIEELRDASESRIRTLRLMGATGRFQLILGPGTSELRIEEPDKVARSMASEIVDILEQRRVFGLIRFRRINGYLIFHSVLLMLWLAAGALWILRRDLIGEWTNPVVVAVLAVVVTLQQTVKAPGAVMYTRARIEQPPWFERNRDALIANAIVSAVFLILGIVIGFMLRK